MDEWSLRKKSEFRQSEAPVQAPFGTTFRAVSQEITLIQLVQGAMLL